MIWVIGFLVALSTFLAGGCLGWMMANQRRTTPSPGDENQNRLMELLTELVHWTDEYSGNISNYQSQLDRLAEAVRQHNRSATHDQRIDGHQLASLFEEALLKANTLQTNLESIESELDRRREQLESFFEEARTDPLTGLSNRRALDEELASWLEPTNAQTASASFALVDIDCFKRINDQHGHDTGDQVLQHFAAWLSRLPGAKVSARMGGDEFAILATHSVSTLARLLDTLRQEFGNAQSAASAEAPARFSFSSGVAPVHVGDQPDRLIRRADQLLYQAKASGGTSRTLTMVRGPNRSFLVSWKKSRRKPRLSQQNESTSILPAKSTKSIKIDATTRFRYDTCQPSRIRYNPEADQPTRM